MTSIHLNPQPFGRETRAHLTWLVVWILSIHISDATYCSFARNRADSLYSVPYYLLGRDFVKMAPVNMTGKWKLDRSENFEDMLKTLGMCRVCIYDLVYVVHSSKKKIKNFLFFFSFL